MGASGVEEIGLFPARGLLKFKFHLHADAVPRFRWSNPVGCPSFSS